MLFQPFTFQLSPYPLGMGRGRLPLTFIKSAAKIQLFFDIRKYYTYFSEINPSHVACYHLATVSL